MLHPGKKILLALIFVGSAFDVRSATIDRMTVGTYVYPYSGFVRGTLWLPSIAQTYYLSDGTSWGGGAGTTSLIGAVYSDATESNGYIYYDFAPVYNGVLFSNTDYDSGSHSSQGTLGWSGDVVLVAQVGGSVARFSGGATILDNTETWYGQPRFNYYSAAVGQSVYFEMDFVIQGGTWQMDTFGTSPNISGTGYVDFTQLIPEPNWLALLSAAISLLWLRGHGRVESFGGSRR
jgi:hypothetical protein